MRQPSKKTVDSFNQNQRFKRFHRLIPVEMLGYPETNKNVKVKAVCNCGEVVVVALNNLKMGKSKSCGCIQKERSDTKHPLYTKREGMIQRTENPNCGGYEGYGGRGIKICQEWRESFKSFKEWAENNGYERGLEIDRIDNDGNYEPNNCRFVNRRENSLNRRDSRFCKWNDEIISFSEATKRLGRSDSFLFTIECTKEYHRLPGYIKLLPKGFKLNSVA